MINNFYQWFSFTIPRARYGMNGWPGQFLNEDDIGFHFEFENSIYDEIIFLSILWKNS